MQRTEFGDNTAAMLMTRGLMKLPFWSRAGKSHGNIYGLAGIGDLIVTYLLPFKEQKSRFLHRPGLTSSEAIEKSALPLKDIMQPLLWNWRRKRCGNAYTLSCTKYWRSETRSLQPASLCAGQKRMNTPTCGSNTGICPY